VFRVYQSRIEVAGMWRGREKIPEEPPNILIDHELTSTLQAFLGQFESEHGGVLLGHRADGQTIVGAAIFPAQQVSSGIACSFDINVIDIVHEALGPMVDSARHSHSRSIVGWVHSHPHLGVFLSSQDVRTLKSWTDLDSDAVAMVIDPHSRNDSVGVWGQYGQRRRVAFPLGTTRSLDLHGGILLAQELRARRNPHSKTFWDVICSDGVLAIQPLPREVDGDRS
jgi:proteasome lid subunit RPN8/RPN11